MVHAQHSHGNIQPFRPEAKMSVKALLDGMGGCSFGARALFQAASVWKEMAADKNCVKLMGLGGALVAAGMSETIIECMKEGYIDALVTTGANLTHDIIGPKFHSFGTPEADDAKLKGMDLYRVYDTYVESKGYSNLEDTLYELFPKLEQQKEMSVSRFLFEIGKMLDKMGHRCMISEAAKYKVPIFCPAVGDSILGFQIWMYQQTNPLRVNPLLDQKDILDIVYPAKKTGAIIIGGGTSKNYVTQAVQTAEKPLSYAVQVTMDRPEPGGVSGASLKEAISWGKVANGAKLAEVICDATIALPLVVSYLKG